MKKEELYKFMIENGIEINKDNPEDIIAFIPYELVPEFTMMLGSIYLLNNNCKSVLKEYELAVEMNDIFEYFDIDPKYFYDPIKPKEIGDICTIKATNKKYSPNEIFNILGRSNPILYCSEHLYTQLRISEMLEYDFFNFRGETCEVVLEKFFLPKKDKEGIITGLLISENTIYIFYEKEKEEGI